MDIMAVWMEHLSCLWSTAYVWSFSSTCHWFLIAKPPMIWSHLIVSQNSPNQWNSCQSLPIKLFLQGTRTLKILSKKKRFLTQIQGWLVVKRCTTCSSPATFRYLPRSSLLTPSKCLPTVSPWSSDKNGNQPWRIRSEAQKGACSSLCHIQ